MADGPRLPPAIVVGFALGSVLGTSVGGCARQGTDTPDDAVVLEVWAHAGQQAERAVLEDQAARFNASQDSVRVSIEFLPEGSYNAQVQASAVAGRLPDLLDMDGPYVPLYAWQGHLRPVDALIGDSLRAALLPSLVGQGSWGGNLYAVGTFDSGLALYGRRTALEATGLRVPGSPGEAWSRAELEDLLRRLSDDDDDGAVLDLKLNYQGEWFTYAFQPLLRSAGGALLRMSDGIPRAEGALNGAETQAALLTLQDWIGDGLVDPNLDDAAFVDGRVALSWSGHWDFPRYADALGEDLVVLPLPDFGEGTRTGQGSWMWTVPVGSDHPSEAAAFVRFLLRPEEVLAMAEANGAVPGTRDAAARSDMFGPGGRLRLLVDQLEGGVSVPRPRTPAYPFVSSVFQEVFEAVRSGEPLGPVLGEAAEEIDEEVEANRGYRLRRTRTAAPSGG